MSEPPKCPEGLNFVKLEARYTTDIDEKNLSYARQNIIANNLGSRIRPLLTTPDAPLIPLDVLGLETYPFSQSFPYFPSSIPTNPNVFTPA